MAIFDHSINCLITGVEVLEELNRWIWIYCNWTKWKGYQIRLWIRWIGSIPRNKFIVCLIPNLLSICFRNSLLMFARQIRLNLAMSLMRRIFVCLRPIRHGSIYYQPAGNGTKMNEESNFVRFLNESLALFFNSSASTQYMRFGSFDSLWMDKSWYMDIDLDST